MIKWFKRLLSAEQENKKLREALEYIMRNHMFPDERAVIKDIMKKRGL